MIVNMVCCWGFTYCSSCAMGRERFSNDSLSLICYLLRGRRSQRYNMLAAWSIAASRKQVLEKYIEGG